MSILSVRTSLVRATFGTVSALVALACAPPSFACPDGFALTGEGRCVPLAGDAGHAPVGDGGPVVTIDGGPDAAADAFAPGLDAGTAAPDAATIELPDAFVPGADACAWATWYADVDGDHFGNAASSMSACTQPAGTVANATDCDDTSAARHPGATEACNGVDDDCDGTPDVIPTYYLDLDHDGHGVPGSAVQACTPSSSYVLIGDDCDDTHATVYPGAPEICNGTDEDCDTMIDEGVLNTYYQDCDLDGYARTGLWSTTQACTRPITSPCATIFGTTYGQWIAGPPPYDAATYDCDDDHADVHPGVTYYVDCDGDGYAPSSAATTTSCGIPATAPASCSGNPGATWTPRVPSSATMTDCFDFEPTVHPGSTSSSTSGYHMMGSSAPHFDYDCDGAETSIYPIGSGMCTTTPSCGPSAPAWRSITPACGSSLGGSSYTCSVRSGACAIANSSTLVNACH